MEVVKINQEVKKYSEKEFESFDRTTRKSKINGFIIENQVQYYLGEPLSKFTDTPDEGWDMVYNGKKVDIKNIDYMGNNPNFCVASRDSNLNADQYLFCQWDGVSDYFYITAWANNYTVKSCNYYQKGDPVKEMKNKPAIKNEYIVPFSKTETDIWMWMYGGEL